MSESRGWWSRELSWVVLLYLSFGLFYMVVLRFSFPQGYRAPEGLFEYFNFRILYLDYPLKALYTLPIWYLTFRVLRHWPFGYRVALNLALLPAWVKGWQLSYYWLVDNFFGGGHLQGPGQWWDIYIPALFYILQFGIFHAWHYYQDLRRTELARAESERLALTSELSALKAQLNPHFLYNAFNTISASTGPGQERTRDMIAQLSDLFRYQLRANRERVLPLADELGFVTDYLALEKERFGDRLDYRVDVEREQLLSAEIAPLLLQPLVENAVRHGLSPLLEGGTVTISASAANNQLTLTVADTGTGFDPSNCTPGYGLTNTRRRLALLYGTALTIASTPGHGTRCTFTIPLAYAPQSSRDRRRSPRPSTAPGVPG
ncbi:sensor histidine kinase [Neolewinella sp.]|uniref:sensor histidine kinase n=1 Tax=Neolewinella sp. TaxID=2993543 RepID=UPI003B5224FE